MKNPEKATVLVEKMLDFAQVHGLMEAEDRCYTRNLLLDALGMAAPEGTVGTEPGELPPTLTPILEELTRRRPPFWWRRCWTLPRSTA